MAKAPRVGSTRDFELVCNDKTLTFESRILTTARGGRRAERASSAQKVPPFMFCGTQRTATDASARLRGGRSPGVAGGSLVYRVDHIPRSDHHLTSEPNEPAWDRRRELDPSREELLGPSTAEYNGYIYVQFLHCTSPLYEGADWKHAFRIHRVHKKKGAAVGEGYQPPACTTRAPCALLKR